MNIPNGNALNIITLTLTPRKKYTLYEAQKSTTLSEQLQNPIEIS
jgi:hypothetical protein